MSPFRKSDSIRPQIWMEVIYHQTFTIDVDDEDLIYLIQIEYKRQNTIIVQVIF